ncbi:MAG: hypothetical protein CMB80_28980, partial [Flammeovirgaceae bacterium]|nr:hypothetical protein [Flammeovirgaceae bacterium]
MKLSFNNKGWMILTTLGVIATIFIYYFLIYVKNQETLMTKNGLRVINQIEHNFNDLKDGLLKSSKVASTHSGERNPLLHEMTDSDLTSRTKAEANDEVFFDENRLIFRVKTKGIENKQASDSESVKYFYIELSEIFQRDILRRDDVFDFIVIHDSKENTNLYTNNRLGNVRFDSILADSLSVYPVELGYDNYLVFTTKLSITQDVFLAGYINQGKFNSGKREVPLGLVILSTISAILFILCLPLIKLKVMSNVERLYISDVLFSGFSLVLIPAVLLLLSLGAASYFYQAKSSTEKELSDISKSISKSFEGELEKIVKQLETLKKRTQDENVNDLSDLAGFLEPLFEDKTTVIWDENFKMKLIGFRGVNSHSLFDDFNYFNGLFWTDSQGEVRSILALRDNSAISINLNHRKYISDVVKNDLVKFKDSEIVLESIRSVTDGSFEVGVGIKSGIESLPVLALSAPMRSTMYSIVKKGYGFCIVDRKGNTLFHSNIEKNLNENFYEETNLNFEGKEIDGAQNFYISKYNGKEQYIYSRQLDNLPDLRIITFADKQYIHTKYTITLYTTLLLYLVFLLLLGLIYSIFYLLNLRTTKLKQLVFPLNWLKPYDTEKHHLLYKYLFGLNGLGIFYLVVTTLLFQNQHEFLLNSLMLVSLILLFINFHYLTINLPVQKRIFSVYYTRDNNVFIPSFIFAGIILLAIIVNRANYWIDANSLFLWDFGMLIFGVA